MGAMTVEYVLPMAQHLDLALGGTLGWGFMELTLRQSNGGSNTWVGEQLQFSGLASTAGAAELNTDPERIVPPLGTDGERGVCRPWAGWRSAWVRPTASCPSRRGRWMASTICSVCRSDVNGKGLMLQGGILVGLSNENNIDD